MKIDEISYLPSLILNNTPITRLDKEYVLKTSTAYVILDKLTTYFIMDDGQI